MKRLTSLLFLFAGVACGGSGDKPTAPATPVDPAVAAAVGTYTLTQVNGSALPALYFQNSQERFDFVSGSLVIRANKSYTKTQNLRITYPSGAAPKTSSGVENGTLSITGSQVTFFAPEGGVGAAFSYTGAYASGVVTSTLEGFSFGYTK